MCQHCGKRVCNCGEALAGAFMSPDLMSDPRMRRCSCRQGLYPGEICSCKLPKEDDE